MVLEVLVFSEWTISLTLFGDDAVILRIWALCSKDSEDMDLFPIGNIYAARLFILFGGARLVFTTFGSTPKTKQVY